jgi:His/Glu/Gln/Arg/opine family amino acid ABC transporter permease subunit
VSQYLDPVLPGVEYTVILTAAAFGAGAVIAVPLALLRRSRRLVPRLISRTIVDLVRSVPPITWLFLIFFGLAQSTGLKIDALSAAIVGLGVIAGAYMSEVYRAGLMAVDKGQWEAARAVGMHERDVLVKVVAPQAIRVIVPPAATYAISLLKDSAAASTIGVLEITYRANAEAQRTLSGLGVFTAAAVLYILLSLPLAVVSRKVDRRLRARFEMA